MCSISLVHSSINVSSFIEQDFLGILCVSGSCFCTAPVARHAEHKGLVS